MYEWGNVENFSINYPSYLFLSGVLPYNEIDNYLFLSGVLPYNEIDNLTHGSKTKKKRPGPGCSKLATSLVNVSLKFQTLISETRQYFLLKKCESFFQQKYQCIWLDSCKAFNKLTS